MTSRTSYNTQLKRVFSLAFTTCHLDSDNNQAALIQINYVWHQTLVPSFEISNASVLCSDVRRDPNDTPAAAGDDPLATTPYIVAPRCFPTENHFRMNARHMSVKRH
jgi:hypothetical protein